MPDLASEPGPIDALESSPWGQILNRQSEIIIDADLPDIAGKVWIRDPPVVTDLPKPCVVISPFSPSHSPDWGTASQPDLMLRNMIAICLPNDGRVNYTLADRLFWYSTIFGLFAKRSNRIQLTAPGDLGADCLYTVAEPGDPRIFEAYLSTLDTILIAVGALTRWPGGA